MTRALLVALLMFAGPVWAVDWDSLEAEFETQDTILVIVRFSGYHVAPGMDGEGRKKIKAEIKSKQDGLIKHLKGTEFKETDRSMHTPTMGLELSLPALLKVKTYPHIVKVQAYTEEEIVPHSTGPHNIPFGLLHQRIHIGADQANDAGWDGSGYVIALMDLGADSGHWMFDDPNKVLQELCWRTRGCGTAADPGARSSFTIGPGAAHPCNTLHVPGLTPNCTSHGTWTATIAAGCCGASQAGHGATHPSGEYVGVAKDAQVILMNTGNVASWQSALEWLVERTNDPNDPNHIPNLAAVSMSMAVSTCIDEPISDCTGAPFRCEAYSASIASLKALDIPFFGTTGNGGNPNCVEYPNAIADIIQVGSNQMDGDSAVSGWADRDPDFPNMLFAPGDSVWGGLFRDRHGSSWGTSASAPLVAGAWTVVKEKNPGFTWQQLFDQLKNNGVTIHDLYADPNMDDPNRSYTRIDLVKALGLGAGPFRPANDTCAGAETISDYSWTQRHSTFPEFWLHTQDTDVTKASCDDDNIVPFDFWRRYVAPCTGTLRVTNNHKFNVSMYDECNGTELMCQYTTDSSISVVEGEDYYIRWNRKADTAFYSFDWRQFSVSCTPTDHAGGRNHDGNTATPGASFQ